MRGRLTDLTLSEGFISEVPVAFSFGIQKDMYKDDPKQKEKICRLDN